MKMERKYVMRRRVVFGVLAIAGLVILYLIVNHIWWTGSGICWGDVLQCEKGL